MDIAIDTISNVVALFFFWLFGNAAYHKITNISEQHSVLTMYGVILPINIATTLLVIIIGIETTITVTILPASTRLYGFVLACMTLVAYTTIIAFQFIFKKKTHPCGCGSTATVIKVGWYSILRNIVLVSLCLLSLFNSFSHENVFYGYDYLLLTVTVTILVIIFYLSMDKLVSIKQLYHI
ncbi:MAG: MauE/DoxX family redox-associated membrane protein [Methylacidiphilales bacterium]|nr:MauE/DoxX family redox-associated membrane protein [Candidatus Methylacidiphilales bacterium]